VLTFFLGKRGVEEIRSHPWFSEVVWDELRDIPAPYIPEGSSRMKIALQELKEIDPSSERYSILLNQITANFDKYHDDGTLWCSSKINTRKDRDHEFIGYTFKRKKDVVRAALTADTFGMNQVLSDSTVPGPPEPASKRPNSQYGTPLSCLSPSSDVDASETLCSSAWREAEETGNLMSPPILPEPSNPDPPAKENVTIPIALRPQTEGLSVDQHFSV